MERLRNEVKDIVTSELERANKKFPLFNSDHEGYAVILEEKEETEEALQVLRSQIKLLWDKVRGKMPTVPLPGDSFSTGKAYDAAVNVACEAIQAAAMILKHRDSKEKRDQKNDIIMTKEKGYMKIKDWHVMESLFMDNNQRYYFYGDLSEINPEDTAFLFEVSYEKWNASDYTEILVSILEDRNQHLIADLPRILLEILSAAAVTKEQEDFIMKKLCESIEAKTFIHPDDAYGDLEALVKNERQQSANA